MIAHDKRDVEQNPDSSKRKWEVQATSDVLCRSGLSGFDGKCDNRSVKESPDVLLDFADGPHKLRLGCEVRDLHSDERGSGSAMRKFESYWRGIETSVVVQLERGGAMPYCRLDFRDPSYKCLTNVCRRTVIRELVVAVERLRKGAKSSLSFPQVDMPALSHLLREIQLLSNSRTDWLLYPSHMQSGEVPPTMNDAIVAAYGKKVQESATYDWCDAHVKMLLLVAKASGLTDVVGHSTIVSLPNLKSPFDWVVVWDRYSEDIWALYPEHAVICDGVRQVRSLQSVPSELRRFATGDERYPTRRKPG